MKTGSLIVNILQLSCVLFAFGSCMETTNEMKYIPTITSQKDSLNPKLMRLLAAYPNFIKGVQGNEIIWVDSTIIQFDDGKTKSILNMLDSADLEDQMFQNYPKGKLVDKPLKNHDPGRIRSEFFFKKMYGNTPDEVKKKLVEVVWLPKHIGKKIMVSKLNGVAEKIQSISAELDKHPNLCKFLVNPGGTFVWRKIKGTNRLSTHSFGITIDINVKYSDYWQWDCLCENESMPVSYKNRIPFEIVDIFEKHGFIWGGKWYHFDTMHFEYRPELLFD